MTHTHRPEEHQIHSQENTPGDMGISPSDDLWQVWRDTQSEAKVLYRLGQLLKDMKYEDTARARDLACLWRHIACTSMALREEIERIERDEFGSQDAMVVTFDEAR
ncbi:hypothetical protein AB0B89_18370 [Sphaerisporangium sp. NPDC049002]|uniref:hypothetical protein n=1 Tax=Sphaerisporangium sp. NPDC049002 TaxID=3155392 RepID=UPI0033DE08E4